MTEPAPAVTPTGTGPWVLVISRGEREFETTRYETVDKCVAWKELCVIVNDGFRSSGFRTTADQHPITSAKCERR